MLPYPRYGRMAFSGIVLEPNTVGATVGSWFCGRNVVPMSMTLMFTFCSVLNECCPTYSTSSADDQGSAIWIPPFHWAEDGTSDSYSNTLSAGGPENEMPPVDSVRRSPYRSVTLLAYGGFEIRPYTELPSGR